MPNSVTPDTKIDNLSTHEFPWHNSTWQQFIKAKANNKLPHAILLSGEEGIGRFSLAKRMAKGLMCINSSSTADDACHTCKSCKTFSSNANPDYTQITLSEDKQQIGVDQIRAVSEFLNYSRSFNTNRVVVIYPAERMNINAANSLLKSLEEPSPHTVIILVTAKLNQLLPTIKSRCQLFTVATPSKDETLQWLSKYQSEQHYTDQDHGEGQEQGLNNTKLINPDLLIEISGCKPLIAITLGQELVDSRNQFFNDLRDAIKNTMTITEMAKKWEKHDKEVLLNWQILLIQDTIKSAVSQDQSMASHASFKQDHTQHLSDEEKWLLYQNLIKQKQYIHTSVNSLMFLENMIMLWTKTIL